jgi:gamma-glutamylcyclotransferase (GGCT)/AIG2-like uncharacterized protein YtfP
LFLYGTLLDPDTLARRGGTSAVRTRLVAATLHGWKRVKMHDGRYPTLRRDRTGSVCGAVVTVRAQMLVRLAAYEGPAYRLTRVVVDTPNGKTAAYAWIAPGGTRAAWKTRLGDRSPCCSHHRPDPGCARTKSTPPRC